MRLYILRHGETVWNAERRVQGMHGSDLSEKGVTLAKMTAEALADVSFDLCITSPLLRAKHTAELVLAGRNVPVIEDVRIREIGFGDWEGLVLAGENIEVDKDRWMVFLKDPFSFEVPPDGEDIRSVLARTGAFLDELLARKEFADATILISTHGCAARALLNRFYDDPTDFWQGRVPPNCSVNIVEQDETGARLIERDLTFYDEEAWGVPKSGWVELE